MAASRTETSPADLRRSVVKLFTVVREPNYFQPWDYGYQTTSGGSGCIVTGNRILTNAHVVSNAVYVQVQKPGDTTRYGATVEHVDHDSEAALLTVEDPAFFEDTVPVRFGDVPRQRDQVAAYGFPIGGNELSITEGVVSRLEVLRYTHSQRELLALQIDAAINPGNSGGPVFRNGRLVGIAFQSYSGTKIEKSGYVVPLPILRHFFEDAAAGQVQGVPDLGIFWQRVEGDAMRGYLKLKQPTSGVMVTRVLHGGSADGTLEPEDVITRVDDVDVASDGSVAYREGERIRFTHLVDRKQIGETTTLQIVRAGRKKKVSVTLRPLTRLVPFPRYGVRPSYLVFGGLVITPLSYNYMNVWDWKDVEPRFKYLYEAGLPSRGRRQVVLVSQVLAHDITIGHHRLMNAVLDRVNNKPIREMKDVLRALKKPLGKHHVFELDNHAGERSSDYHAAFGTRLVLPADRVEQATSELLERYGIGEDRSEDMRD